MTLVRQPFAEWCRRGVLALAYLSCVPAFSGEVPRGESASVVCISSFEASAGDPALEGISIAVADLLQASLARHPGVTVVDRTHLAKVMGEHEVTLHGLSAPATAARVGGLLGADKFITGSVTPMTSNELVIVAHVLDVRTTTVLAGKKVSGPPANLADLSVDLAGQLATVLNIQGPSAGEYEEQPMGSVHVLRGLGFFQAGNHDRALAEFMLCGDKMPDHPTSRYWVGLCYIRLNAFDHAKIELGRFLREQPNSDKAAEAKQLLKECEERLKDAPSALLLLSGSRGKDKP